MIISLPQRSIYGRMGSSQVPYSSGPTFSLASQNGGSSDHQFTTMAQASPPSVLGQTYHSTLETCIHENNVAVIKRCRHTENPRTRVRWKNEVGSLKIAGAHVRNVQA